MNKNIRNNSLSSNTLKQSNNINRPTTIGYSIKRPPLTIKRQIKPTQSIILDNEGMIPTSAKKTYTKNNYSHFTNNTVSMILEKKNVTEYPKVNLNSTVNLKSVGTSAYSQKNIKRHKSPALNSISEVSVKQNPSNHTNIKNSNVKTENSHMSNKNSQGVPHLTKEISSSYSEKSEIIKHKEQFTPKHKTRQNDVSPKIFFNVCITICFVLSIWFPVSHILSNLETQNTGFSSAVSKLKNLLRENSAIAVVLDLDKYGASGEGKNGEDLPDIIQVGAGFLGSEKELAEAQEKEQLIQQKVNEYISKVKSQIASERPLYVFPLDGPISSTFSWRSNPFSNETGEVDVGAELEFHAGLDISASISDDIVAFADGKVSKVSKGPSYGNFMVLDHDGFQTLYAHCEGITAMVGQEVKAGDSIAVAGSTGRSTAPHLHFEVRIDNELIDPYKFMQELGVIK